MEVEVTKQLIELADTAIKIGLGALISGVATYYVTKSNHKHEFSKEKFNQKVLLLTDASGILEDYFNSSVQLMDLYYGIASKDNLNDLTEKTYKELLEIDENYRENIKKVYYAISKFHIIGFNSMNAFVADYDELCIDHRNKLMLEKDIYFSQSDIRKLNRELKLKRERIYKEINSYFEDLS